MSKQRMLVPNLNVIMAEYKEETEEAVAKSVEKLPMEESQKKNGGKEEVKVGNERINEEKGE